MCPPVDRERILEFMRAVGDRFKGEQARVYLVGGSSLVYEGVKSATVEIDVDVRETPDSSQGELLRIFRALKEALDLNIEEASPADFIPLPKGARDRARFLGRFGHVDFFHYDHYSVALSKINRGQERDFEDVLDMLEGGLIEWSPLARFRSEILPEFETRSLEADPARFTRHFEHLEERWSKLRSKKDS